MCCYTRAFSCLFQGFNIVCHVLCTTGENQTCSSVLSSLLEQVGMKMSELDSHPVRSAMKQLLRSLDQLCPFEPDSATSRPDYMRSFLDYINMLASVLVRSLGSEGERRISRLGDSGQC